MTVGIVSWGLTPFGRRPEGLVDLLALAGAEALERWPGPGPDALVVGSMAGGTLAGVENLAARVADALGLSGRPTWRVEAASATGAAALQAGHTWLLGSPSRSVLVIAGEKMTDRPGPELTRELSRSLSPEEFRHGATMPSMAALLTSLYLERWGIPVEELGEVTVRNRACASRNPRAHLASPVTLEQVNASRIISSPLRLLHVSPVSDGAAAVLLVRDQGRVHLAGLGQGTDVLHVLSRGRESGFRATRIAATTAYGQAAVSPAEVGVAEVHDAFAPFELMDLEDLGFCAPGQGLRFLQAGRGDPEGELPVNPSGGLLGRGHPVGASGLAQVVEVYRQMVGEAEGHQIGSRPRVGLAQSVGGLGSHNFVTILARSGAA
jgi:acetyl-CoA C-acetyltransferase